MTDERMAKVLRFEQECLWNDLDNALRHALNGRWSMGAESLAGRIGAIALVIGPTDIGDVPWRLSQGGVYEALYQTFGIPVKMPSEAEAAATEAFMTERNHPTSADLRAQMAPTVRDLKQAGRNMLADLD